MLLSSYLTCTRGTSDKFYDIAVNAHNVVVHIRYGRTGTAGTVCQKKFSSPRVAVDFYHQKLKEKRNRGYLDTQRPSSAPPYPLELTTLVASGGTGRLNAGDGLESRPVTDYALTWKTTDPIEADHIEKAFGVVSRFLESVAGYFPETEIVMTDDGLGPCVKFRQTGNTLASFGFLSQAFVDSLTPNERAQLNRGRVFSLANGRLTGKGHGSGVIVTRKNREDILIRLFLSVLQVKAGLQVSCPLGLNPSDKGLFVSGEFRDFGWFPLWKDIFYPAVRRFWLIHGEGIFLPAETKTNENGLQAKYAW